MGNRAIMFYKNESINYGKNIYTIEKYDILINLFLYPQIIVMLVLTTYHRHKLLLL